MMNTITLRKAMRLLDENEAWTVGTENGQGWLLYHDGKELHDGTRRQVTLDQLLNRLCVEVYDRPERESLEGRNCVELKAGKAFIVEGDERGNI